MTRMLSLIAGKLGPPLLAVMLAGLLLAGFAVAHASLPAIESRAGLAAAAGNGEQCYAWEALNATDQDADSLRIELTGVQTVTKVYAGDANPLGGPGAGSGYDAGNDRFTLVLGPNGSTVGTGETVRVGLCTPEVASAARFQWLAGVTALLPDAFLPALAWEWPEADTLQLRLTNTTGVTITLTALQVLDPGMTLDVDDLDAASAGELPVAGMALDEPLELAPSMVVSSTLSFEADPTGASRPALIEAQWAEGDDLSVASSLYAQTSTPAGGRIYLPAVSR